MTKEKAAKQLEPIWVHAIEREIVTDPNADPSQPPAAIQLNIHGETQEGGPFIQSVAMPVALFTEMCHQIRTQS